MKRSIVTIDESKCVGCGLCVKACNEGALQLVNGKAKLISETYCDGLGNCLPSCPVGAITIEERDSAPYSEEAVHAKKAAEAAPLPCGCPGTMTKTINRPQAAQAARPQAPWQGGDSATSALTNWPVQIKLMPVSAPYLENAALLVAADCTAFAYPDIHRRFMQGKVTLIGCPKLDSVDYTEKLTAILEANDIRSITALRMEVPCCAGIANAVKQALINSGRMIPWQIVTIATDGTVLQD